MFSRFVMTIGVAALMGLGPANAQSDDQNEWRFSSEGGEIALAYEGQYMTPEAADTFKLSCEPSKRNVSLSVETTNVTDERSMSILLSAGTLTMTIKGRTVEDKDRESFSFKADNLQRDALFALLRQPGELSVRVGANSQHLNDKGRADGVKNFAAACKW